MPCVYPLRVKVSNPQAKQRKTDFGSKNESDTIPNLFIGGLTMYLSDLWGYSTNSFAKYIHKKTARIVKCELLD